MADPARIKTEDKSARKPSEDRPKSEETEDAKAKSAHDSKDSSQDPSKQEAKAVSCAASFLSTAEEVMEFILKHLWNFPRIYK